MGLCSPYGVFDLPSEIKDMQLARAGADGDENASGSKGEGRDGAVHCQDKEQECEGGRAEKGC